MSAPVAVVLEGTVDADCPAVEAAEIRDNSDEIAAALKAIGYGVEIVTFTFDTHGVREQIKRHNPSVVFNLVDDIEGKGTLVSMAPMLLAHMGLPYTGANAVSTCISCDKLLSKHVLRAHGIRTAEALTEAQIEADGPELARPYILKSITEHASFGMFADSVVSTRGELKARLREKKREYGSEWFAEEYIDGREFNVALLAMEKGPQALPAAEITFTSDFPRNKPRIIDYAAKWHKETPEYKGTVRSFSFSKQDETMLATLTSTALACWDAFSVGGYARVDFRVDEAGGVYVLEVNCNPFLTANEGFGVAAKRAGLSFNDVVRLIVADAYRTSRLPMPEVLAA